MNEMSSLMAGVDIGERLKLGWTRAALEEAVEVGLLDPRAHYEILGGDLYEKMGQNWPHSFAIGALIASFRSLDPDTAYLNVQVPILANGDLPEPDLSVVGASLASRTDHPTGRELLLVVEVADSSLGLDRNTKAPIYALSGVPVYWIVDLTRSRVEVHSRPEDGHYSEVRIFEIGESIPPAFERAPAVQVSSLIAKESGERQV
jgi:Uma2 family endonuclease